MEDGFSLKDATIGIYGLGLMGGSLALALKGHCSRLIGFDSDLSTLELAVSKNIVDQTEASSVKPLPHVDLLILATPVPVIIQIIPQLSALMPNAGIVIDLGSTKREIVEAMNALPPCFEPIGGHPICGKEKLGLENAEATLYQNAPFVITPLERTTQRAKSAAVQILSVIGARWMEMTPEEHDNILATTSHLPFLLASALVNATSPEFAPLVGPGFRSTSRLAGTPLHMMMGVLKSNRDNVMNAIQGFRHSLDELEFALQHENDSQLEDLLNQSHRHYQSLTEN